MGRIASKLGTGLSASGAVDMRVNDTNAFTKTGQGLSGTVQMPRDVTPTLNPNYVKPDTGFLDRAANTPSPAITRAPPQVTLQQNPAVSEPVRAATPTPQATRPVNDPIVNFANTAPPPTPYTNYPIEGERRDAIIRTVMGEAAGEGLTGMAAVANVIYNRSLDPRYPSDPLEVATQKNSAGIHQFSAWNSPSMQGNTLVRQPDDSPEYQKAARVVDAVFAGLIPDPTGGATHYHTKTINPVWGREGIPGTENVNGRVTIGDHVFYPRGPLDTVPTYDDTIVARLMERDPITGRLDSGLMAPTVTNRATQPSGPEDSSWYSAPSPFSSPSTPSRSSLSQPSGPEDSGWYSSGGNAWSDLGNSNSQPSGPEDSSWSNASNPFGSSTRSSSSGSRNNSQPSGPEDSGWYSGSSSAWDDVNFGNSNTQPSGPEDSGWYASGSNFMSSPSPSPSTTSPSSGGGKSSSSSSGSSYNSGVNNYGWDYDYI